MKVPGINTDNGNSANEKKRQIIKTINESKKSTSDIYRLIWMNSNVSGVKVNRSTCGVLLSHLKPWIDLPLRIRERIYEDITNFMGNDCLPLQAEVERRIAAHPIVMLYLQGTLPPESADQYRKEEEERRKRKSDIEKLRIRTGNEIRFIEGRMKDDEAPIWDNEKPTAPGQVDLKLKPYSESFYRSYLGIEVEDDDIEFPDK